ncbi:MAG: hypothetical protein Q9170_005993 [Blastenia crenularia]
MSGKKRQRIDSVDETVARRAMRRHRSTIDLDTSSTTEFDRYTQAIQHALQTASETNEADTHKTSILVLTEIQETIQAIVDRSCEPATFNIKQQALQVLYEICEMVLDGLEMGDCGIAVCQGIARREIMETAMLGVVGCLSEDEKRAMRQDERWTQRPAITPSSTSPLSLHRLRPHNPLNRPPDHSLPDKQPSLRHNNIPPPRHKPFPALLNRIHIEYVECIPKRYWLRRYVPGKQCELDASVNVSYDRAYGVCLTVSWDVFNYLVLEENDAVLDVLGVQVGSWFFKLEA